jgi:mannose-1-phosphate guanylyltransferase
MAGGFGSRFWPICKANNPKQFIDILGNGQSMLQATFQRFENICPRENIIIVTGELYADRVRQQIKGLAPYQVLSEPTRRNTAPCIAYACWKISRRYGDVNIVITPSDALVLETGQYAAVIRKALDFTDGRRAIVTVGIAPTRPETGYGYIQARSTERGIVQEVASFREKPDAETARFYLEQGNYFWNAGVFVWNSATIISEMRTHAPSIASLMDRLSPSFYTEGEEEALKELFPQCEKISIDYAVMEKSDCIHVIATDLGWSDLGSWTAVHDLLPADSNGNAVVGDDVRLFGCRDCVVHVPDEKTVVVEGLEGYIISEIGGNLLVCRRSREQSIKEFSKKS